MLSSWYWRVSRLESQNQKIFLADFKSQDFSFLKGCSHYYQWMDVGKGIEEITNVLQARQQGMDSSNDFRIVAIDELASYLNSIEKKEAEKTKLQIASLLMLGRSFNIHVLVSQQRPDASYFAAGARDNFNVIISLGNPSKEAKQMFAFDDDLPPVHKLGSGYMLTNNTDLKAIQVPKIKNMDKLHAAIKRAVE